MGKEHVGHSDIRKFAEERVNLPKEKAGEYRQPPGSIGGIPRRAPGLFTAAHDALWEPGERDGVAFAQ
mgnify:CR=1 FL=1